MNASGGNERLAPRSRAWVFAIGVLLVIMAIFLAAAWYFLRRNDVGREAAHGRRPSIDAADRPLHRKECTSMASRLATEQEVETWRTEGWVLFRDSSRLTR